MPFGKGCLIRHPKPFSLVEFSPTRQFAYSLEGIFSVCKSGGGWFKTTVIASGVGEGPTVEIFSFFLRIEDSHVKGGHERGAGLCALQTL
mgnify:CR=1 FL=1